MKPTLTILTGDLSGEKIVMVDKKTYIVGRDKTADIALPEKKISRRHASLRWDSEKSKLILEDLRSLNGSFVNGVLISEPQELQDKDRFQIGSYLFEVAFALKRPGSLSASSSQNTALEQPPLRRTDPSLVPPLEELFDAHPGTDTSSISGKLSEVSLGDLLQLLAATKKSGRLVITTKKKELSAQPPSGSPSLYLQEGELIGAELRNLKNEEAFYEILKWQNGYFSLYPLVPFAGDRGLQLSLEALLLEGYRRLDEEKTATVEFQPDNTFDVKLDEPLSSLDPEELRIFQLVWRKKKMQVIWESSHLDQKSTNGIMRKLLRGGYIKKQ